MGGQGGIKTYLTGKEADSIRGSFILFSSLHDCNDSLHLYSDNVPVKTLIFSRLSNFHSLYLGTSDEYNRFVAVASNDKKGERGLLGIVAESGDKCILSLHLISAVRQPPPPPPRIPLSWMGYKQNNSAPTSSTEHYLAT